MFTKKSIDSLQTILSKLAFTVQTSSRDVKKYELTDKYLQKTGDYTEGTLKGEHATETGDKSKIRNVEVPLTFMYKETAHAFLTGTFLTGHPIFAAVSNRETEDTASMLTNLSARDEVRMGWAGNLLRSMDDVLRYRSA